MRHIALTAALATGLLASPLATSGEAFVNGQLGRIALDSKTLDKDSSNLLQLGGGYRWGIGPVKAGVEAGFGRIGEVSGGNDADGDSRAFDLGANHYSIGANARIKPPLLPVQFIARAGYIGMRNTLEQTVTAPATGNTTRATDKHTSGGTYLGAGIGTTLLPLLDVSLMYNRYRYGQVEDDPTAKRYRLSDDKQDAQSVSLMVEYRF